MNKHEWTRVNLLQFGVSLVSFFDEFLLRRLRLGQLPSEICDLLQLSIALRRQLLIRFQQVVHTDNNNSNNNKWSK